MNDGAGLWGTVGLGGSSPPVFSSLHDDARRTRLLVEQSADVIVVVDGHFIPRYVSAGSHALLGYAPVEMVGKPEILVPHPVDASRVKAAFLDLVEAGRNRDCITYRLRHRDGRWIWVEAACRGIDWTGAGPPLDVAFSLRDVTERMATDAALRETAERCCLLLQSPLTEALYLLDPDGNIETWNASAQRLKGYTADEIIGRHFSIFFTPEDIARGVPMRVLAGARDGPFATTAWRLRKDGSRFMARVALDAIRRDDGTLRGFVKVTLDITNLLAEEAERDRLGHDLARARDQAEQATLAKSRFLSSVTHELRTPLHGILGYAELLSLEGGLNPTQSARVEVMINSGQHLLDTINAVLDMSQIEADQLDLQPVEVELSSLIHVCLNVVRPAAEAKGLILRLTAPKQLHVFADPTRLRQALINLLGNAVKFTSAGAVDLRMREAEEGEFVRLEVADTGPGIWLRHRDKLFKAFERLNANTVDAIEGTGLGLAIAARLVHLMDGRIGYFDNPGGGSVFWFELPVHHAAARAIDAALSSPLEMKRRLRVLVADDEVLNRNIADNFVTIAGHEVVCVDNGAAAVEAASAEDFDVILMDVRMPGMNGMEATRRIRALPAPRGAVRVIAVTAQAFAQQIEMCRQAGMDGHVSKPFKRAVLLAALENIEPRQGGPAPPGQTPTEAIADMQPKTPLFDRGAFEDATDCLDATEKAEQLRTLVARCDAVFVRLSQKEFAAPDKELIDQVHKLAGGAGVFGFASMAAAARQFEFAADTGSPDSAVSAGHLVAAIAASMPIVRRELNTAATSAA